MSLTGTSFFSFGLFILDLEMSKEHFWFTY